MTETTNTHTTAVVTLWVNGRDSCDGMATLTQIMDATGGHTVHIVTIDERAAEFYGIRQPVSVIGGLVRTRGRWAPTAYRDRAHLLDGGGLVYYLPNASSRVRAVRALLRWWVPGRDHAQALPRRSVPASDGAAQQRGYVESSLSSSGLFSLVGGDDRQLVAVR